ncbi:HlyD family efflux transporter periplasmic adaptor subunit [Paenisporosarcina cavernae]|uniref:HlyD family efflux transporter periplasmic adaptor subunit n=1 Tax=Paenisporosarcina cavernae TaxID=2320858 RepID=A0A385YQ37_9BACL|nr:HlyD family secretion protein [Paenisporosarcina cavernae]AYC28859.1 HlyD family efflux transporter periplasmic adaptor subunit [Paenisporosarcina cavernae]
MNKQTLVTIGFTVAIASFLATNAILLFSDKSTIAKTFYVHEYEKVTVGDYNEQIPKESLVAPFSVSTVYVANEDTVEQWLLKEGDPVTVGAEIATINRTSADDQRAIWEAEKQATEREITDLNSTVNSLEAARQSSDNTTYGNENSNVTTPGAEKTNVGVNVNVNVDVDQEGAYAGAIAETRTKLAEAERRLQIIDAQLAQTGAEAILSPVDGVISEIREEGGKIAVDLFAKERIILTYATEDQWKTITPDNRVWIQVDGVDDPIEGTVISVAQVPAADTAWLKAYKKLDPKEETNPLHYYEVRVQPLTPLDTVPYGLESNAVVLVNEASNAVSVRQHWLIHRFENEATAQRVNEHGYAEKVPVTIAFDTPTRSVLTDGLEGRATIIQAPVIDRYQYAPRVFYPMPVDSPSWNSVKHTHWKTYLHYLFF